MGDWTRAREALRTPDTAVAQVEAALDARTPTKNASAPMAAEALGGGAFQRRRALADVVSREKEEAEYRKFWDEP